MWGNDEDNTEGNALNIYVTEEWTVSEIKGQDAERVKKGACFLSTTNYLLMRIEVEDQQYGVVEVDCE